jgi:hypothetical protein
MSVIKSLGGLSEKWLRPNFSFRKLAGRQLVEQSKFEEAMAGELIDSLFRELTAAKLLTLLKNEISNPKSLDDFQKNPISGHASYAQGPALITHIFSGNIPNPSVISFVLGMLVKSANIGKLSSKDQGFLEIYIESLKRHDRKLALTNLLLDPSDRQTLKTAIEQSNLVVGYGSNQRLREIQEIVPSRTSFIAYGHRVSFGLYAKEALTPKHIKSLARSTARDIWMADQRGCLSPLVIFAQKGGKVAVMDFAKGLAEALEMISEKNGRKPDFNRVVKAQNIQNRYQFKKISGQSAQFWLSSPKGLWGVYYDEKIKELVLSEGNQQIYVKAFSEFNEVFQVMAPLEKYLQAVSLEAPPNIRHTLARRLALLGVNRITRAGRMQTPPVTWHHDGKPNLAGWLTWTDLE